MEKVWLLSSAFLKIRDENRERTPVENQLSLVKILGLLVTLPIDPAYRFHFHLSYSQLIVCVL